MLIGILVIIYVVSFLKIVNRYSDKNVEPSFWAFLFLLCPVLNTILAIKLTKKEDLFKGIKSFKSFIKELEL